MELVTAELVSGSYPSRYGLAFSTKVKLLDVSL